MFVARFVCMSIKLFMVDNFVAVQLIQSVKLMFSFLELYKRDRTGIKKLKNSDL